MESSTSFRILVFSKTAAYRHESIPAGIEALTRYASTSGSFSVDASEDASLINTSDLKKYTVVVLLQTSGDFLDDSQVAALKDWTQNGGGLVGIHCASSGMKSNTWYGGAVGAVFTEHPDPQDGIVKIEDTDHVITKGLPTKWEWFDEWYNFRSNPRGKVHVLMSIDEACYKGGAMGDDHPLAWCQENGGFRSFYTSLGHFSKAWDDDHFLGHVVRGIQWAARRL
ncbi:hypothetical protein JX266_008768 [Neoarthrinium moseri]|nr:hypothetical protein JX266_008768 [Neoarthrinium moseri]